MKKFLVLASIILLLSFVTTSLFSIAFNINLKRDAHAVENIFNSVSVGLLFEKYLPQETYYDGPQNNPSPLIKPFNMLFLGVGFFFFSLIGRKKFKSQFAVSKILRDNGGRRLGIDRRQFSYDFHIPERRFGKERRSGNDRRRKSRTQKY